MKRKRSIFLTLIAIDCLATGCSPGLNKAGSAVANIATGYSSSEEIVECGTNDLGAISNQSALEEADLSYKTSTMDTDVILLDNVPGYSGTAAVELNGNQPLFTKEEVQNAFIEVWEDYSELDALGRCGVAYANVCLELQPTEAREEIGSVKPSGWHTVKYNGLVDGNYLYNRCHLIGYQLTGENANEKNLITGTRYMNVTGMLPYENLVDDYLEAFPENHVLYRVTPIFTGDNLVADGVTMEAYSVEDSGRGVCFYVFCYNVQPGISIDYATGESWMDDSEPLEYTEDTDSEYSAPGQGESKEISANTTFVVNVNTGKFHRTDCDSVIDMASSNILETDDTVSNLMTVGYEPCKRCNPDMD